ncbi:hypothetical protein [Sinomonas soli]
MNWHYALPFSVCAVLAGAAIITSGAEVHGGLAVILWIAAGALGFFQGIAVAITSRRGSPPVRVALVATACGRPVVAKHLTTQVPAVSLEPALQAAT